MDESQVRNNIIANARKKYIPDITMNISKALELYLKSDDNTDVDQIPLILSKKTRPKNIADLIGRPVCPGCGESMMLRIINTPQGKQNRKNWKTCWECLGCGHEEYSIKAIEDLIRERG